MQATCHFLVGQATAVGARPLVPQHGSIPRADLSGQVPARLISLLSTLHRVRVHTLASSGHQPEQAIHQGLISETLL